MFTQEELGKFQRVLQNTPYFIEIECGCTDPKYGDTPGKLRLYIDGSLEIDCTCIRDCNQVNMSPIEYAKHGGKMGAHMNWKNQIWVFGNYGDKLPLRKTCLLKYSRSTHDDNFQRPVRQVLHRDEFKECSRCHKHRRFVVRTKQACKAYHEALLNHTWKCSDMPDNSLRCNDPEERECRKENRGCPRDPRCPGCEQCVCLGCDMCRFQTCACPTCVEFVINM